MYSAYPSVFCFCDSGGFRYEHVRELVAGNQGKNNLQYSKETACFAYKVNPEEDPGTNAGQPIDTSASDEEQDNHNPLLFGAFKSSIPSVELGKELEEQGQNRGY